MNRLAKYGIIGFVLGVLFALFLSACDAKEVTKDELIKKPLTVEQYRVQRSQLDRMRRRLLFEMSQAPEWMHDADQVQKVYRTVMMIDTLILQSYLQEQDAREEWAEQQQYIKIKGDTNADSSN